MEDNWFDNFKYNFTNNKKFRYYIINGVILLVIGLTLLLSPIITKHLISSYQPTTSQKTMAHNNNKKGDFDYASVKRLSLANVAQARAKAKDLNIIGEIAIPDDHIHIPIAKGINNAILALAAGTFRPDMKMGQGNYALAGHNMANHSKILFSPLYDYAKPGQKIYITNLKHVYTYKMTQRTIINPNRVDVVQNTNEPIVTLITCDETGSHRLMIRGKLIKKQTLKHSPKHIRKLFTSHYND